PMVLGSESEPLDVGRKTRTIPAALRRAIEHRDGGCCTWPGCTAPASWCDVHHDQHWADGGVTSLANCRLLCRKHHTATHQHEDSTYPPAIRPPKTIDPGTRAPPEP
ncbi:MAG: HNH endonuclease, partial [Actinomycetota bacterium]